MVKTIDILATLIQVIREKLKDINIESSEVEEGYRKNSLYIYLENTKSQNYMEQYRETRTNARIIYRSKKDNDLEELLDVQEELNELFADEYCIDIEGVPIEITNVDTTISDGDLLFNFDVYVFEEYPQPTAEMMEELYIREV